MSLVALARLSLEARDENDYILDLLTGVRKKMQNYESRI